MPRFLPLRKAFRSFKQIDISGSAFHSKALHLMYKCRGEASGAIIVDIIHSRCVSGEYAEAVPPCNLLPMLVELPDLQCS